MGLGKDLSPAFTALAPAPLPGRQHHICWTHLVGISTGTSSLSGQMYLMIMTAVTYQVPITLRELQEGTGDRQHAACLLCGRSPPRLIGPIFLPAQPRPAHSSPPGPPLLSLPTGIGQALSPTVPRADANAILLCLGTVPCRYEWQTWQQGDGLGFGQEKEASVKEVTLFGSPGPAPAARLHQDAWWNRAGLHTTFQGDPYWLFLLLDGQPKDRGQCN